jgi:CheY-like chemotaxis protein
VARSVLFEQGGISTAFYFDSMTDPAPNPSLSILLVEDHPDTALAIGNLLAMMGHTVQSADSVEAAVRVVIGNRFDLIISDVGLPDGNGVSLMHGIRPFCDTPAIALTGYGGDDDVARCLRAGFNRHLTKPVGARQLGEAIAELQERA